MNYCWNQKGNISCFLEIMDTAPHSYADIFGSNTYPNIHGQTLFYQTNCGTLVVTEVFGLPIKLELCHSPIFAFHIHEGSMCVGNDADPFKQAMSHYNPNSCTHPYHAGDLPPLFGNDGYAFSVFLTNKFSVCEMIGKTIIIHSNPDDFTTQPSGNSGTKIACGVIQSG